jgi:hypothetical protein
MTFRYARRVGSMTGPGQKRRSLRVVSAAA